MFGFESTRWNAIRALTKAEYDELIPNVIPNFYIAISGLASHIITFLHYKLTKHKFAMTSKTL